METKTNKKQSKTLQEVLKPYHSKNLLEAGLDEAGCGGLVSRVYACAVIWQTDLDPEIAEKLKDVKDSKKLSEKKRYLLRDLIEENVIDFGIGYTEASEIDKINILQARVLAMHRALNNLKIIPDHLLIDGNYFKDYTCPKTNQKINHTLIEKGDNKFLSIASASILAKCYHDDYILKLHKQYPMYGLNKNHGYGTTYHYKALKLYGPTPVHRMSFNLKLNDKKLKNDNNNENNNDDNNDENTDENNND